MKLLEKLNQEKVDLENQLEAEQVLHFGKALCCIMHHHVSVELHMVATLQAVSRCTMPLSMTHLPWQVFKVDTIASTLGRLLAETVRISSRLRGPT